MADDEVLDHDHVAEKLAFGRIGKRPVVGEFMNLADVVEKGAGEEKVASDLRIIVAHEIAGAEQRNDVIKQAADVGVVKGLGRGGVAVRGSDFRIGHEALDQRFEMRVLKGGNESG